MASENNKNVNPIELLSAVTVLNRDDGVQFTNTERLDAIEKLLVDSPYKKINETGVFRLYARFGLDELRGRKVILVSTHVDCQEGITECFSTTADEDCLKGIYDNSITNTAILKLMLEEALPDNVVIAFTGDEEVASRGADAVYSFLCMYGAKIEHVAVGENGAGTYRREPFRYDVREVIRDENDERFVKKEDGNIDALRERYPDGLHFVVGDTHGEGDTLMALMEKIKFDPSKDHVYFLGDFAGGGYLEHLLSYIAQYYEEDYEKPGFHLIRGNHEREMCYSYPMGNMPDIIVLRGKYLNYYLVHAGMVHGAFRLINKDMAAEPTRKVFAYSLTNEVCGYDRPYRQITWSRHGLYSQRSHWHTWPFEKVLHENRACILHGHSPYSFFMRDIHSRYGDNGIFFTKQHVWFSEALQAFNLDSDIKGRSVNGETYRGLTCLCLEVTEEIAAACGGKLTTEGVRNGENGLFSMPLCYRGDVATGNLQRLVNAQPAMKTITMDSEGKPYIVL